MRFPLTEDVPLMDRRPGVVTSTLILSPDTVPAWRVTLVDRGGLQPHEQKRVERLEAVWELAKRGLGPRALQQVPGSAGQSRNQRDGVEHL